MNLTNYHRDAFINAAMQDVPTIDYREALQARVVVVIAEMLPPKVRVVWLDPKLRCWIRADTAFWVPNLGGVIYPYHVYDRLREIKADVEVARIIEAAAAQAERLDKLRANLRGVAYACRTAKALREALPEFASYVPKEPDGASPNTPALANVVTEFVKAGWPKDKSKAKPAAKKAHRATDLPVHSAERVEGGAA